MTFLPFLLNRSKLPICSNYFFLFWPLTLQTLNGSSTVLVSTYQVSPLTFLPFLLNRSKLPICSYYLFLFWPLTLQTLNGSSTVLVSTSQVSPLTFLPFLLNRSKLPICSYYFFLFWPLTLQTLNGSSTLSQHLTRLANDFPAFFAAPVEVTNMLIQFFSLLACQIGSA